LNKVLIITYYWPPAAGAGVFRVLKFAKYLPRFGWKPIILTVKNGEYPATDHSLESEIPRESVVYNSRMYEPADLYKKFTGMPENEAVLNAVLTQKKQNWRMGISHWIRLNVFIPDAKIGWIPGGIKRGTEIIRKHKPDILFSTSPPPTVHLIARWLATHHHIPWVADFRDPWTNIYYYDQNPRSALSEKIDVYLEKKVLESARAVTAVNNGFFSQSQRLLEKCRRIPNGYDPDDMPDRINEKPNEKFTIRYMGSLKRRQYVDSFFGILEELSAEEPWRSSVKVDFIGRLDPEIIQRVKDKDIALEINFLGYQEHSDAIQSIAAADLLLMIIGRSDQAQNILLSKLFEYLMVGNPILAYGPPEGDASAVLSETSAGEMFNYDDYEGAQKYIVKEFERWKKGEGMPGIRQGKVDEYSRRSLTEKLTEIFEEVL